MGCMGADVSHLAELTALRQMDNTVVTQCPISNMDTLCPISYSYIIQDVCGDMLEAL